MRTHSIVIVGAGAAGTAVAARVRHAGARDVVLIDPQEFHYYQPLWTLVGGGLASMEKSRKSRSATNPPGAQWIRSAARSVDPDACTVSLANGEIVGYKQLVMAPGVQLDTSCVAGLSQGLGVHNVSTNYRSDLAPHTWDLIRRTTSGTAIFTQPSGPIKCAGAPQKIAYLAADYWRHKGVLADIDIHLVLPTPKMFGIPHIAGILSQVAARYGIHVHCDSELVAVDGPNQTATIRDNSTGIARHMPYAMMHATPPQSAPDWVKNTALAAPGDPLGYIDVDKHTLQHVRYPNVFALGDACSTPNSKTGAAVRKQAPVVAANMKNLAQGRDLAARYNGYASCPITTSRSQVLIAEFDYSMQLTPTNPLPFPDTTTEIVDFHTFKKYALPALYWQGMMKGMA